MIPHRTKKKLLAVGEARMAIYILTSKGTAFVSSGSSREGTIICFEYPTVGACFVKTECYMFCPLWEPVLSKQNVICWAYELVLSVRKICVPSISINQHCIGHCNNNNKTICKVKNLVHRDYSNSKCTHTHTPAQHCTA